MASSAGPVGLPLRYVALGDSYTIGTAVEPSQGFPSQLVAALRRRRPPIVLTLTANLGANGYTSDDLIREELPALEALRPDVVTLLIGVNDVVQGVSAARYAANLETIFKALGGRLPPSRIVTIETPDYTSTPRGADYGDRAQQRRAIQSFNAIMAEASAGRGLSFVPVFDLSARAATDRSLVAGDGLHPSGAQYHLWVGRIAPVVAGLLAGDPLEVSDRRP